jgi:protein-S-isoprenylcysteine O-methyltransferase Ste14/pimeloyl-ACP methyl ester carboxylesterase
MAATTAPREATSLPWIRGIVFTVLVPGTIAVYVPLQIAAGLAPGGGVWQLGWLVSGVGVLGYLLCFLHFLSSGGTPAIFFTRPVRFLIGEEPQRLVQAGLYRVTRNPMYVSVLLVIFGQALHYASLRIAEYGLVVWLGFHIIVVLLEEPHLRDERGLAYDEYCRRVPRWIVRFRIPGSTLRAAAIGMVAVLFGCHDARLPDGHWQDPSPHKTQFVEVQKDIRLEVLDWGGTGRALVLLSGAGLSAHIYDEFAPKLATFGHVYGISRRGYGESSKPETGYDNERLADDIFEVITALKLKAPVLIGHSMAGNEITTVANAHSDRLGGLVYMEALFNPKDLPANDPAFQRLSRQLPARTESATSDEASSFAGYRISSPGRQMLRSPRQSLLSKKCGGASDPERLRRCDRGLCGPMDCRSAEVSARRPD